MTRKKYVYLIIIFVFMFGLLITNSNLNADTFTLEELPYLGEVSDVHHFYELPNDDITIKKVYKMTGNGKILYCLEPGKHAYKGATYTISDNDDELARAIGITREDKFSGMYSGINKVKFSKYIISYIYNCRSNDDNDIVAKQLLIWHYMKLIREAKNPLSGLKINDKDKEILVDDGKEIKDGCQQEIRILVNSVNTEIDRLFKVTIFNGISNFLGLPTNAEEIQYNYYKPNSSSVYPIKNQQILIGPKITPSSTTEETKKYNLIIRYWGPYGYESSLPQNNITYTGDSYTGSVGITNGIYTISGCGIGDNSGKKYENGLNTYTVTGDNNTVYIDYTRGYLQAKVTVNYYYTDSSGIQHGPYSKTDSFNDMTYKVDLNYTYGEKNIKEYCCYAVVTQGKATFPSGSLVDGKSKVTFSTAPTINELDLNVGEEGDTNINVDVHYKSKKIVVDYVKIEENGNVTKENKYSKEVNVNDTSTEYPIYTTWKDYYRMKVQKPDGTFTGLGVTSITNGSKRCSVQTYTVYYEVRDIWKYMKKYSNDGKTGITSTNTESFSDSIHTSRDETVNSYSHTQTKYDSASKKWTLPFNYGDYLENYFPSSVYSDDNKYVVNNLYKYGKASTSYTVGNTKANDRKKVAKDNLAGTHTVGSKTLFGYLKTDTDNEKKQRSFYTLEPDNYKHADTMMAYFYYDIEHPVYIYVRHVLVDDDGSYNVSTASNISFLKNDDEKYYDSVVADSYPTKQYKVIKNGYNQRKWHSNEDRANCYEAVPTGFSEYYTIDKNDRLYLDKSRTLLNNGIQYKFLGCRTRNNPEEIPELNKAGDLTKITSAKLIRPSSANSKIYVDFYYTKDGYSNNDPEDPDNPPEDPDNPPEDPPRTRLTFLQKKADAILKFQSQNSFGNALGADTPQVAYVPASEYIKPYFETASYIPYNLKYKISVDGKSGNITYDLEDYKAYQFDTNGGTVTSSEVVGSNNENVISSGNTTTKDIVQSTADAQKKTYTDLGIYEEDIPVGPKTTINNFDGNKDVSSNRYNGYRDGDGTVKYILKDVMTGATKSGKDKTLKVIDSMDVNVYTPMSIDKPTIETTGSYVDHSVGIGEDKSVIQKDTEFKLTPKVIINEKLEYNSNLRKLDNYLKGYIVVFDFDVRIKGESGTTNAGTPIWVNKDDSLYATPVGERGSTAVNQLKEKVTTIAVTINEQGLVNSVFGIGSLSTNSKGDITKCKEALTKSGSDVVIGSGKTAKMTTNNSQYNYETTYGRTMNADAFYFVKNTTYTYVLARLYDFKITDCYDVNFKNVFRTFDKANGTVNGLTNVCFYSGKNKLVVAGGNNIIYTRAQNTILPIGPYKHTQRDYIKAPKLGYRISFDVKTYGYYDNQTEGLHREVKITPSYYYISKDGTTYNDNIKLYYKNSSGKYVTFNDSYSIAFKPNDGYRNQYNNGDLLDDSTPNDDFLSTKMVNLSVGNSFTLSPDTMMTTSNDKFIQAWYGEFKVPNSTIVVDANNIDLNNPLTDGYLGVIFKIECIDTETSGGTTTTVKVLYDQDDKAKGSNNHNTSQWDYEGYMGSNSGTNFNGSLQLENGKWSINDSTYQKIKGTVVLYDLDDRAANDFD